MPETAPNNEARSSDEPHNQENSGSPHEDKKSSAKKVEANRRNAQKSTGPRTAQGKARVRSNAIKHGWLADQVLLFTYSEEHRLFAALMKELWQHFEPVGTSEAILVQQIAIGLWRERQGLRWEIAQKAAASWFVPVSASEEDSDLQEREREPTPREILLGEKMPDIDRLDLIIRYQAANDRRLHRAFTHLERLQRSRKGEYVPAPISVSVDGPAGEGNR